MQAKYSPRKELRGFKKAAPKVIGVRYCSENKTCGIKSISEIAEKNKILP